MADLVALTPSQTIGPFLHICLPWDDGPDVVSASAVGALVVGGRVLDGNGEPVADALVETWQADAAGVYDHREAARRGVGQSLEGFRGFGRCATDEHGRWAVRTVKPGRVPAHDGAWYAPHIAVSVFARGLLDRLVTRIYFADEGAANERDPVLGSLAGERRATLIAAPVPGGYRFDLRLQGDDETVFFRV